jgi:hypothetical protein
MVVHQLPKKLAKRVIRHLQFCLQEVLDNIENCGDVLTSDAPMTIDDVDVKLRCAIEQLQMARDRCKDELRELAEKGGGA